MTSAEEQIKLLQEQLNQLIQHKEQRTMAVSVKLPPFWTDKPMVWFGQVEAQFELSGIKTDSTKYSHVIAMLDSRIAGEVADIIENPPESGRYEYLKQELTKRLSASSEDRIRRLLGEEDIGDSKPSQFLRRLRSLAGTEFKGENIIRQLWLRRLPANIQAILAAQDDLPLDKAANIADKVLEVSTPAVHAIDQTSHTSELAQLALRVEQLTKCVEALSAESARSRSQSRSNNLNASNRTRSNSASGLCWYHRYYRQKARKCTAPCSWKSENEPNDQ